MYVEKPSEFNGEFPADHSGGRPLLDSRLTVGVKSYEAKAAAG